MRVNRNTNLSVSFQPMQLNANILSRALPLLSAADREMGGRQPPLSRFQQVIFLNSCSLLFACLILESKSTDSYQNVLEVIIH